MSVHTQVIPVGSATPVLVSGTAQTGQSLWIQNETGGGDVTLGAADIVAGAGPKIPAGGEVGLDLQRSSDELYAICAPGGSATLLVLRIAE